MRLRMRSALLSLQGARPRNEDAVLEAELPNGGHLVAVADGMGGHRSGEIASEMAVEILRRELRAGRSLVDALHTANAEILEEANRNAQRAGMGTTAVAIVRSGSAYQIANVGDSRAYRVDRGGIRQLTVDHSFAAEAARAGGLSPEEIARSPWRNALTRSLGTQPAVEVDVFGPFEIAGPPHAVLVCTDGVYRALSDEAIRSALLQCPDPSSAVSVLAELAIHRGSDDNVSLALIEFGELLRQDSPDAGDGGADALPTGGGDAVEQAAPLSAPEIAAPPGRDRATVLALPSREARRRSRRVRRRLARLASNDFLFLLCAGALLLWVLLNTTGR